jgi:hypothetical protein
LAKVSGGDRINPQILPTLRKNTEMNPAVKALENVLQDLQSAHPSLGTPSVDLHIAEMLKALLEAQEERYLYLGEALMGTFLKVGLSETATLDLISKVADALLAIVKLILASSKLATNMPTPKGLN